MVQPFVREQNLKRGILYGVLSAFSLALMSIFVKEVREQVPTSQLVFFRFGISLIILIPWLIQDKNFSFKIQQPFGYVIRIIAALLALFLLFYVIKFLPLVDALLLNNTSPLFVPLIVWLMRGVKTSKQALLGILIGFIGVGVILQPDQEILRIESLIALASGFFSALAVVQLRLISKTSPTSQMLFYYFFISTLVSGLLAALQWQPQSPTTWLMLIIIGILGTAYQVLATLTYVTAPVRLMAPLIFLAVIFAGFLDWIIWGQIPDLPTLFGAILVIIGAIITVYFGKKDFDFANSPPKN
ncbi:MAG: DMT family transporter [Tatlockia sp.]|nr:DMT family transporter [Tatlockia sp.]